MNQDIPTAPVDSSLHPVLRFNEALNARDVDTMMRLLTDDCIFENTDPQPDGERYEGQAAVRRFWEDFFRSGRKKQIEIEEIFACGDRCTMRWVYRWTNADGSQGHVRGVDLYTVRGERISEKLSYVKG